MALTPEQEWTLVGCGLVAHADEILDIGEWDEVLRYVGSTLSEADQQVWMEILSDQDQLEQRFAALGPLPDGAGEELLRRCWQMALADGVGTDIEASVHDRIARRVGVDLDLGAPVHLSGGFSGLVGTGFSRGKGVTKDAVVWREYLETVVKERADWKDLYRACLEVA